MTSINETLIIARSGILTHQKRLGVVANNIANVNTPGYHRQEAVLATTPAIAPTMMSLQKYSEGTGVTMIDVVRTYNDAKEAMLLQMQPDAEYHNTKADALSELEALMAGAGTGDASLDNKLHEFWSAWQDVAVNPESIPHRSILIERSAALTGHINMMSDRISTFRSGIAAGAGPAFTGVITDQVAEVNSLATRIADLNNRITYSLSSYEPNSLMDERTQLIRELSSIADVTVSNTFEIRLDGELLVSADGATQNNLQITATTPAVTYLLDTGAVNVTGGTLGAWTDVAAMSDSLLSNMDNLANSLIADVNALHANPGGSFDLNGNQGINFFTGAGSAGITVNPLIHDPNNSFNDNPALIAAATTQFNPIAPLPNTGDGSNALAIAQLVYNQPALLGNQSYSDYLNGTLGTLGAAIEAEQTLAADGNAIMTAIMDSIQAESGVNLDEELIEMIEAQKAYDASVRVFNVVDEMLDTIIHRIKR